jgi:hypothetical protein
MATSTRTTATAMIEKPGPAKAIPERGLVVAERM